MAVNSLRLDVAVLIGFIMGTFLYGIFQVLFVGCIYVLVYLRSTESLNWHFLITAIIMWILIGINFAFSWSRVMDGFVVLQPAQCEDPDLVIEYFTNMRHWKELTRIGTYVGLTLVADILFIYRCYIVWGRIKRVIVLPVLLLCGSITSGVGAEFVLILTDSSTRILASDLAGWVTSFLVISLVQNVLTTLLIVYRIWSVNMKNLSVGSQTLWPVAAVVLESGALYSATLFLLLMAYISNSSSQYIAIDMLVPIIGITFNLIIVRVGLGLSQTSLGRNATTSLVSIQYPMQNISINVSQHVIVDNDIGRGQTAREPKH